MLIPIATITILAFLITAAAFTINLHRLIASDGHSHDDEEAASSIRFQTFRSTRGSASSQERVNDEEPDTADTADTLDRSDSEQKGEV
jgi:hypothetical protein